MYPPGQLVPNVLGDKKELALLDRTVVHVGSRPRSGQIQLSDSRIQNSRFEVAVLSFRAV